MLYRVEVLGMLIGFVSTLKGKVSRRWIYLIYICIFSDIFSSFEWKVNHRSLILWFIIYSSNKI